MNNNNALTSVETAERHRHLTYHSRYVHNADVDQVKALITWLGVDFIERGNDDTYSVNFDSSTYVARPGDILVRTTKGVAVLKPWFDGLAPNKHFISRYYENVAERTYTEGERHLRERLARIERYLADKHLLLACAPTNEPKVGRYIKRPITISALLYDGTNQIELAQFVGGGVIIDGQAVSFPTPEGRMLASVGDWIIQGVNNEFYPCKPDIFAKTYDEV